MAIVKQSTGAEYQFSMTGTEFALVRTGLGDAERISRFGVEVLDEANHGRDGDPSENSRLPQEIDTLAMREASLWSLQKTMSEADHGGKPAPTQDAALDRFRSIAAVL